LTTPLENRFRATPIVVAVLLFLGSLTVARAQDAPDSDPASAPSDGTSTPSAGSLDSPSAPAEPDSTADEEDAGSADRPYWRQNLFGRFFRDQKFLFTTWWPSEFRRPGFTFPLLGGTLLAASAYRPEGEQQDMQLESYIRRETRNGGGGPARALSTLGDAGTGAVLIGAGYLIGRWSGQDHLAEASSLSAEALLSAGLWSSALKLITGRPRPGGGTDGKFFEYHAGQLKVDGSFPSGHATGAFAVATVFAQVYRDHPWVSWVSYGTAGLIGVSRVVLARHYPSDVIVGSLLGNSFGRMVVAHEQESGAAISSFQPYYDPNGGGAGIMWTRRW
jgi:PAP2 superfamily protein